MDWERELVFARYLVTQGVLERRAVKRCLRVQSDSWQGREREPLAEVLLAEGLLAPEELELHLGAFERGLQRCNTCQALFYRRPAAPDRSCPHCARRRAASPPQAAASGERTPAPSPRQDSTAGALAPGQRFGDYEILEVIARGGMGVVCRARHLGLDRIVALKVLRESRRSSPEHIKRFKREAQAFARLDHPHIVRVHEFGYENGQYFFTMDYIGGGSLESFLADPERDLRRGVEIIRDVARGLAYAHAQGIVHRDIKPANILLEACPSGSGRLKARITDFGLARSADSSTTLTQEGELLGTPLYMSPEQLRGRVREVDRRSDIYSLGVILYQHLSGRLPHLAQTMVELQYKVVKEEPEPLRALVPALDPGLATVVHKCLEKRREDRYQSADELADELDRWLAGRQVLARPPSLAGRLVRRLRRSRLGLGGALAAAVVLAAGLGGVGYLAWRTAFGPRIDLARAEQMLELELGMHASAARAALNAAETDLRVEGPEVAVVQLERARSLLEAAEAAAEAQGQAGVQPARLQQLLVAHGLPELRRQWLRLAARLEVRRGTAESLARAVALYEQLLAREPEDARSWLELGQARYRLERLEEADAALGQALALEPGLGEALRLRGQIALVRRRWAEAEAALGAALAALAPGEQGAPPAEPVARAELAELLLARARARLELGRDEGAAADVAQALALDPIAPRAWVLQGELALRRGERLEAARAFDRAVELGPEDPWPYLHRGRFLLAERDFSRAAEDLQLAIDEDDTLLEAYLWHGIALYHLMDDERARRQLRHVASSERALPEHRLAAWLWLGRSALAGSEPATGLQAYQQAAQLAPASALAWLGLGWAHLAAAAAGQRGTPRPDVQQAEAAFARALALAEQAREGGARLLLPGGAEGGLSLPGPSGPEATLAAAHRGAGEAALAAGRPEGALARFERALELQPGSAAALAGRGRALWLLGRQREALEVFRAALAARLPDGDARWFLRQGKKYQALAASARVELDRQHKLERALAAFRRVSGLVPRYARAWVERARVHVARGEEDAALAACAAALEANPVAGEALLLRARLLARRGDATSLQRAAEDLTRALEVGLREPEVRLERGQVWLQLGESERAREDLEAAVAGLPGSAAAHAALAQAYRALGRGAEAARAEARVRELADEPRRAAVERLRERARRLMAEEPLAALAACDEALALEPLSGALYQLRAEIQLALLDQQGAIADLARAIELEPVRAGALYEHLHHLTHLLDWQRAFERVAGTGPGGSDRRSEAWRTFAAGVLYLLRVESARAEPQDIERGLQAFVTVLEDQPTSAAAYLLLGILELRAGDLRAAKEDLETALVLEPRCQLANLWLAAAHAQQGKLDLAFSYLQKGLEPRPPFWSRLRRDRLFDPLRLDGRWERFE
ncbi:MAG: hypothetical protein KatS3mg102_2284 [Planctomycetota bacterium]|nr:MAG: hypothetical protein KatS3mg102_2284 [Planctomycetota bacterium]